MDDDAAALSARISGAMQAAKSFVITGTRWDRAGTTSEMIFVAPDRYKITGPQLPGHPTIVMVLIGRTAYRMADGCEDFRKDDAPPWLTDGLVELRQISVERILPNKTYAGKTWGQFTATGGRTSNDKSSTYTYDLNTFRLRDRSYDDSPFLSTYDRYDDTENLVEIPANVASAEPTS